MDFKEIWIQLPQNRVQFQGRMDTIMKFWVP